MQSPAASCANAERWQGGLVAGCGAGPGAGHPSSQPEVKLADFRYQVWHKTTTEPSRSTSSTRHKKHAAQKAQKTHVVSQMPRARLPMPAAHTSHWHNWLAYNTIEHNTTLLTTRSFLHKVENGRALVRFNVRCDGRCEPGAVMKRRCTSWKARTMRSTCADEREREPLESR
jgi:hypothetical protein